MCQSIRDIFPDYERFSCDEKEAACIGWFLSQSKNRISSKEILDKIVQVQELPQPQGLVYYWDSLCKAKGIEMEEKKTNDKG